MKPFQKILKVTLKVAIISFVSLALLYALLCVIVRPSSTRNWNLDQKVPVGVTVGSTTISLKNIRNVSYTTTTDYTPAYYDKEFRRGSVKKVWFVVEPFSQRGLAHTFLSFEFDTGEFLSISVEIRKEVGESFHPIKGLLRRYELMYVVADERDVINLRANYRNDKVYLYPAKISTGKANELFESMLTRAQKLETNPEFYNTLTNTCTTNIVKHINSLSDGAIPFDMRILFPEDSDYYAYELGLIDTTLPKDKIRAAYFINPLAEKAKDDPQFSRIIRMR